MRVPLGKRGAVWKREKGDSEVCAFRARQRGKHQQTHTLAIPMSLHTLGTIPIVQENGPNAKGLR